MKRQLLAERDLLVFDPWDALVNTGDKTPLWGGGDDGTIRFRKTAGTGITISIYGTIAISDLTGKPTIEDLEIYLGDGEISSGLSETFIQELIDSVIEEAA